MLSQDNFKQATDHPHAYGDKVRRQDKNFPIDGSSPRVWGQETVAQIGKKGVRIIPTRMGTSFYISVVDIRHWDHPHAYGDKSMKMSSITSPKGSSPRVWGQEALISASISSLGIIPTRMGTSCQGFMMILSVGDHPHAYGDKVR